MAEATARKDNIIRPEISSKSQGLTANDIINILQNNKESGFKVLTDNFSRIIDKQTSILDRTLNKIISQLEASRLQSLTTEKLFYNNKWFDLTKKMSTGSFEFGSKPTMSELAKNQKETSFEKKNMLDVNVVGISPELLEKLVGKSDKKEETDMVSRDVDTKGIFGELFKMGLGGLVGASFMGGSFDDGPLQGISKLISRFFIDFFTSGLTKITTMIAPLGDVLFKNLPKSEKLVGVLGKIFSKNVLKKIPVIGSIFSLGVGLDRISDGDYVGGVIDIMSGIANFSSMFIGPAGWAISLMLDVANASLDASEAFAPNNSILGIKNKFNEWIVSNAKYIPILSTGIYFGESMAEFSMGNILNGLQKLGMAMPFVPNLVAGIEYMYSWGNLVGTELVAPVVRSGIDLFGQVKNYIKENFKKNKVFAVFSNLGEMISDLTSGNYVSAFKKLGMAIPFMPNILEVIQFLTEENTYTAPAIQQGLKVLDAMQGAAAWMADIFGNLLKSVIDKAKQIIKNIMPARLEWLVNKAFDILGLEDTPTATDSALDAARLTDAELTSSYNQNRFMVDKDYMDDFNVIDRPTVASSSIDFNAEILEELKLLRETNQQTNQNIVTTSQQNNNNVNNFVTKSNPVIDFRNYHRKEE